MKANEIKTTDIINYLVSVFSDDAKTAEYLASNNPRFIMVGGWAANVINAPINRAAFLATFGEGKTAQAEQEARSILADRVCAFESSQYFAHTIAADAHKAAGQPAPAVGSFVWCLDAGLKCEGGAPDALAALYWNDKNKEETPARLVRVDAVYYCTAAEMTAADYAPALVANNMPFAGGATSDDFDEIDFYNAEQMRTVYTIGAAVVDPAGRWYVIDSEGYNYSRYILLPLAARDVFADMYDDARAEDERRAQEERAQEEAKKAAALAEYTAKCAKWSPYMEEITPYIAKVRATPYSDKKASRAADRALSACRRRNVLAMARAAFPGVKFSAKKANSYSGAYLVEWTDGPTLAEFKAATNYEIFAQSWREFNGWNDCGETVTAEFTEFSERYFCENGLIECARNNSEEKEAETLATLAALIPGVNWNNWGRDPETACKIYGAIEAAGLMPSGEAGQSIARADNAAAILRAFRASQSYYSAPTSQDAQKRAQKAGTAADGVTVHTAAETAADDKETAADSAPTSQDAQKRAQKAGTAADGVTVHTTAETAADAKETAAPHISLHLCEMAGGVYVEGSTRATYCNRKAIKAHGATWNKNAARWEAREPAAVAALRAWFALQKTA